MSIQELAAEALNWFEQITVDNELVWIRKINTPAWIRDIVHTAQDGFVTPEKWRYAFTVEALTHISQSPDPDVLPSTLDRSVDELWAWQKSHELRYYY